ncbi:hypothetical protein RIF29_01907 [Crotalaria pallida]|uniref:Pectinesterase n=1 Tax=Crotalaria pallida TaxID=3830 RepID=A0AAN9IZ43_CROPI
MCEESSSNIVANTSETDFVDVAANEVEADMEFDQDVTMNEKDQYCIDGMDDIGMRERVSSDGVRNKALCYLEDLALTDPGMYWSYTTGVEPHDIGELPKCVIMPRWTKFAKQGHELAAVEQGNWIGDNLFYSRLGGLMSCCRRLCNLASRNAEDYKSVREKVCNEIMLLEGKSHEHDGGGSSSQANRSGIMDPIPIKRKGGGASSSTPSKQKRVRTTRVQDTLWDRNGHHYFHNCYVQGAIDFIFGDGRSIYENSVINFYGPKGRDGTITAQKRESINSPTGFVFKECYITGFTGKVELGRAYGPHSRVIIANSYLSDVVKPEGWSSWGHKVENITYVEVNNTGPGAKNPNRVKWMKNLDANDELNYFLSISYIDQDGWIAKQRSANNF